MKLASRLISLFIFSFLTGCATYGQLTTLVGPEQQAIFRDGKNTLLSSKLHTVTVSLGSEKIGTNSRADFIVSVRNGSDKNIVFSTENISASLENAAADKSTDLHVFSYAELVQEAKNLMALRALSASLQDLAASVNTANAGYTNTTGTYYVSTSPGYGPSTFGTYSATTYDYVAAQAAQNAARAESEARHARVLAEGEAQLRTLETTLLKKQTVFPGEWYGGHIKVEMRPVGDAASIIVLKVNLDGEVHTFRFKQAKKDR